MLVLVGHWLIPLLGRGPTGRGTNHTTGESTRCRRLGEAPRPLPRMMPPSLEMSSLIPAAGPLRSDRLPKPSFTMPPASCLSNVSRLLNQDSQQFPGNVWRVGRRL